MSGPLLQEKFLQLFPTLYSDLDQNGSKLALVDSIGSLFDMAEYLYKENHCLRILWL